MRSVLSLAAIGILASLTAGSMEAATLLYDNTNNFTNELDVDARTINFGYSVADSFTLSSASTVQSVNFWLWETAGSASDDLESVQWSIITATSNTDPLSGGTVLASGTADGPGTFVETNGDGYNIYEESFSTSVALAASTTYWLILQGAVTNSGNPIYWDQSDGPSVAYQASGGVDTALFNCGNPSANTSCSQSFEIFGTTNSSIPSGVPEPGTLTLLGGGLALIAGFAFRKRA